MTFSHKVIIKNYSVTIKGNPILFNWRGDQNLERGKVERYILRNFKIANIKITKDELFDSFIVKFIFSFFKNYLNNQNIE